MSEQITVQTADGPKLVPGKIVGRHLAVRQTQECPENRGAWTITHVATGLLVMPTYVAGGTMVDEAAAEAMALLLDPLPGWEGARREKHRGEIPEMMALRDRVSATFMAAQVEHPEWFEVERLCVGCPDAELCSAEAELEAG